MGERISELFGQAGCDGQLCVQSLDGLAEIAVHADQPVALASVVKVPIALEAESQFTEGRLDPRERVVLPVESRVPGPVGFSLFRDDVEVSLRDLVVAMLTISDNVATDALLHRVGIDAVNTTMARLGLASTIICVDMQTLVDSIGRDAGFSDWAQMTAWAAQSHTQDELDRVEWRVASAAAMDPGRSNWSTPREAARLLRLIWSDQAGPAEACARVRQLMGRQLTRHRLASAFGPPARVAAKSGGLVGIVRNEIGVIEYPDGRAYAATIFTQAHKSPRGKGTDSPEGEGANWPVKEGNINSPGGEGNINSPGGEGNINSPGGEENINSPGGEAAINAAIGAAAAVAVSALQGRPF